MNRMFSALRASARGVPGILWLLLAFVLLVPQHAASASGLALTTTTVATDLTNAMKVIFADPLVNNVVSDSELMDIFQTETNIQTEETTGGRYIEMAHLFGLPAGVGARAENDYIPEPDAPNFANSRVYLRKIQGVIEMSGDTMKKVMSDEGAFLNYAERSLPFLVERLKNEVDRMYIGFGAGIKARVTAGGVTPTGTGMTVPIDRALGITGYEDAFLQFLERERVVFSSTAAGTALRNAGSSQSGQITSVDENTGVLTIACQASLSAAVSANDYIFAGDSAGASSQFGGVDREIAGLLAGVDDGNVLATYNNIARSGNRLWQAIVIAGGTAPWTGSLTEDLLTFADDEVTVKGAGKVDQLVLSRSAARSYWKSLKGDRQFINPQGQYTGGKSKDGLSIMLADRTLPFRVARKLPPNTSFLLQKDTWRRITLGSWEWDDRTGAIWNRVTDAQGRKDAFYAVGNMYEQLFCLAPRKNCRIDGLVRAQ